MSRELACVERSGGVDAVVLDSPADRIALSIRLMEELVEQVGQIVAGAGGHACSSMRARSSEQAWTCASGTIFAITTQTHSSLVAPSGTLGLS